MTTQSRLRGVALVGLIFALGCSGGAGRYDVDGAVTFEGKPVPAGIITFEPDLSKGPDGPRGSATIKDGHYDTRQGGVAPMAGAHRVRVQGFDGQVAGELPYGRPLFDLDTEIDLPTQPSTHDLHLPTGSAK